MDYRSFVVPAAAADCATLFVALELSGSGWLMGLRVAGEARTSRHSVDAGDLARVVALIGAAQARLIAQGRREVRVLVGYEAGRDGFWVQRALEARGIPSVVLDAASIEVPQRARRRKSDGLDVEGLIRVLMALARGEAAAKVVRPPSPEEEDARRPGRERERLVEERVAHVNRIKGLLATQGVAGYEPMRHDRRARLDGLRTPAGAQLPPGLAAELRRELARLELVLAQIAEVEAVRDAVLAAPPPEGDRGAAALHALFQLKAIGAQLATTLGREVFYRSFDNRRQLAAYLGLDGTPWRSGSIEREQGISKAGNPRARTAAIELAWLWLRWQPGSRLARWFHERVAGAKGAAKRSKIVALARKLVVALWRYVTTGLVPDGAELKRTAAARG
jgi:transposase